MPRHLRRALSVAAVLAATVAGVASFNRGSSAGRPSISTPALAAGASVDQRIDALEQEVDGGRHAQQARVALGNAYLQKARETGDGGYHKRAEEVLRRALDEDPRNSEALAAMGAHELIYHRFAEALDLGRRAQRAAPATIAPYPVVVDSLIELGRYREAAEALQRWVDLKPGLPVYARISYYRELHGDLRGAKDAMALAVSSAAAVQENAASVRTLLGELHFATGDLGAARRAHEHALQATPDYGPALAGLARIDAALGRYEDAADGYREAYERAPKPEYAISLAETLEALGEDEAARRQWTFSRDLLIDEAKAGTMNANELALIEADHFDRERAVALGREAWRKAPSVVSADALGWALTRSGRPQEGLRWARRALSIGSRFPRFLVHAGLAAHAAGRPALARRWLRRALADNPQDPVWAPRARQALEAL